MNKSILPLFTILLLFITICKAEKHSSLVSISEIVPSNSQDLNQRISGIEVKYIYGKNGKKLIYVATPHINQIKNVKKKLEILKVIKKIFKNINTSDSAVIVEGFPTNGDSILKTMSMEAVLKENRESIYTAKIAYERNIKYYNGEPNNCILKNYVIANYAEKDYLGFIITRFLAQRVNDLKIRNNNIKRCTKTNKLDANLKKIASFLNKKSTHTDPNMQDTEYNIFHWAVKNIKNAGYCFNNTSLFNIKNFKKWYLDKVLEHRNATGVSIKNIKISDTLPDPNGNILGKLASYEGVCRDYHILQTVENLKKWNKTILIVYGSGHIYTQKRVLEKLYDAKINLNFNHSKLSKQKEYYKNLLGIMRLCIKERKITDELQKSTLAYLKTYKNKLPLKTINVLNDIIKKRYNSKVHEYLLSSMKQILSNTRKGKTRC